MSEIVVRLREHCRNTWNVSFSGQPKRDNHSMDIWHKGQSLIALIRAKHVVPTAGLDLERKRGELPTLFRG
jgi:hypothetical protein